MAPATLARVMWISSGQRSPSKNSVLPHSVQKARRAGGRLEPLEPLPARNEAKAVVARSEPCHDASSVRAPAHRAMAMRTPLGGGRDLELHRLAQARTANRLLTCHRLLRACPRALHVSAAVLGPASRIEEASCAEE